MKELAALQKWHDYQNMRKAAEALFGGTIEKEINSNTEIYRNSTSIRDES